MMDLLDVANEIQPAVEPEDVAFHAGWECKTTADADWAMERMAELAAEAEEADALLRLAVDRIRSRTDGIKARALRTAASLEAAVKAWAAANRSSLLGTGRKKSRDLPCGTVAWRKKGGRLEVEDKAALQAWIDSLPEGDDRVRVRREADMKEIQKDAATDGVIPPGMRWVEETDEVEIKPAAPALTGRK